MRIIETRIGSQYEQIFNHKGSLGVVTQRCNNQMEVQNKATIKLQEHSNNVLESLTKQNELTSDHQLIINSRIDKLGQKLKDFQDETNTKLEEMSYDLEGLSKQHKYTTFKKT